MSLTVLNSGLCTLLVDAGRPKSRALGMPVGGPADTLAFRLANVLLNNPQDSPALEITLAGPTLRAEVEIYAALVGSPFAVSVNNEKTLEMNSTFLLKAGDVLRVGGCSTGARAYLAVKGGFRGKVTLNSQSSLNPLKANEVLPCDSSTHNGLFRGISWQDLLSDDPIRVLPGPQYDWFHSPEVFTTNEYTVSPASNRMGLRLTGLKLERKPGELPSEPVAPGAVQITNDGLPVVLGMDGQTIGGYPKLAHVVYADWDRLGRLRPGDKVRFRWVDEAEAKQARLNNSKQLQNISLRLSTRKH